MGNDQYPETITETNNVLINNKFDNNNDKYKNNRSNNSKMYSHYKKLNETNSIHEEYSNGDIPQLSFTQLEGKCYCYGKQTQVTTM